MPNPQLDNNRHRFSRLPLPSLFEGILLLSMLATLLIPSQSSAIAAWNEVNPSLFLRAIVWLLGLLLLPGFYVIGFTKVALSLSKLGKIVLGINLSLALFGLSAMVFYAFLGNLAYFEWFALALVIVLGGLHWLNHSGDDGNSELHVSKWSWVLLAVVLASCVLAFFIQVSQLFLIPGDFWASLNPGVRILSQRSISESFTQQYPIAFGFILAGLSVCTGLPIVNVFVSMFPLVALNIASFYFLAKVVFLRSTRVSTIASIIYAFGGGLAWIFQIAVFDGSASLWTLNHLTQDIFFAMPFWNTMEFSHRTLALTLMYSSAIMFALSYRLGNRIREVSALALSSMMLLFSFLIHMIELIVCVPIILAIAYVYRKNRKPWRARVNLTVLTLAWLLFLFLVDLSTSHYYYWLTFVKLNRFLTSIRVEYVLLFSLATTLALLLTLSTRRLLPKHASALQEPRRRLEHLKLLLMVGFAAIYMSGIFFLTPPSDSVISSPFPWYLYVTRYGFIGLLALVGVAATDWKERWLITAGTWSVAIVAIGSIWWGTRMNSYLFPAFALLGAVGTDALWRKAHNTIYIIITDARSQTGKHLRINLKPIMATMLITTIALSFGSLIYGASYYATNGPSLDNDTVKALQWINENTPQNTTILVPSIYNIHKGVNTIADRKIYFETNFPTTVDLFSFINLTQTLQIHNVQYALTTEDESPQSYLTKLLLTYSNLAFQSGKNRVHELPKLTPTTLESSTVVIDRESLGLTNTTTLAWYDDNFTSNWAYKRVNATTDGEVLTYRWNFYANNTPEPSMKAKIPPISTDTHPYLIISYRNTQETTSTAEDNLGQIVTLINATGYPKGFLRNVFLPVSKQNAFNIFIAKLPENQEVAEIWIWMRNYKKLNGTVDLQIDFLGFSSVDSIPENPTNTRFLTMTIPALWTTDYTIVQNLTETQKISTIVSTYDKSTPTLIPESTAQVFVFFNQTATPPSWGINWQEVTPNIITGSMNEKKIILCGTRDISQENILIMAELIYNQTQYPQP